MCTFFHDIHGTFLDIDKSIIDIQLRVATRFLIARFPAYTSKKGALYLAYYLAITVGMILCLGMLVGGFVFCLSLGLNNNDSSKVDSVEKGQDN